MVCKNLDPRRNGSETTIVVIEYRVTLPQLQENDIKNCNLSKQKLKLKYLPYKTKQNFLALISKYIRWHPYANELKIVNSIKQKAKNENLAFSP